MYFDKVLIANRGEIAIRVARGCRELGIETVAVFSEVDRSAKHVRYCDEAYKIGPAPSSESYLVIEKIIETALESGCQAIHPGYGFLAENAALPAACVKAGLTFIGPTAEAMALLGSKTEARKTMEKAGVPIIPGIDKSLDSAEEALEVAKKIGYPVLLKAAAGGGGKGVRIVDSEEVLSQELERAQAEAQAAFGDPSVFLEKYIVKPRHVEIQILADEHGNVIHLNERECSVQRRYQKLVEESPSCILDDELRQKMGETAIKAVQASGYTNAGTVEFLVDSNRDFYFLEVNTRLQVEHPVTELITGIDLVREQIRVAAGEKLTITQEDVGINGASIECRISAEDPDTFLPSTGIIKEMVEPAGPGVRVESGIAENSEVSIYYDPLLAKVIVWAPTRQEAIDRMLRALEEYKIKGVKTTIPFHLRVLKHEDFVSGNYDTGIVPKVKVTKKNKNVEIAAIAATIVAMADENISFADSGKAESNAWKMSGRGNGGLDSFRW